ncbi:IGHG protein, partial [Atlantisia rogersi]|nr:IGHG protein [Atlantisia rogersi]
TGRRQAPGVYVWGPPAEETSSSHSTLSLTCLVRGFYPEDVSVEWQKNQEAMGPEAYEVTR